MGLWIRGRYVNDVSDVLERRVKERLSKKPPGSAAESVCLFPFYKREIGLSGFIKLASLIVSYRKSQTSN